MDQDKYAELLQKALALAANAEQIAALKKKFSGMEIAVEIIDREVTALNYRDNPNLIGAQPIRHLHQHGLLSGTPTGDNMFLLELMQILPPPNMLPMYKRDVLELALEMFMGSTKQSLARGATTKN